LPLNLVEEALSLKYNLLYPEARQKASPVIFRHPSPPSPFHITKISISESSRASPRATDPNNTIFSILSPYLWVLFLQIHPQLFCIFPGSPCTILCMKLKMKLFINYLKRIMDSNLKFIFKTVLIHKFLLTLKASLR
jgi:hypothetical protein